MKVECPVCHVQGVLQQRGKSSRIQHYVGFQNGKRVYLYHKTVGMEVNGSKNGSKCVNNVEVKKTESALSCRKETKKAPPKGLEPLTDWLTASRSTGLSYGGTALRLCTFSFIKVFKFSHFTAKC